MENNVYSPITKNKLDLAKDIVNNFPVLKGSNGEGFVKSVNCNLFYTTFTHYSRGDLPYKLNEQWFSPVVRGGPTAGFIADRFKNFRARNLLVVEKQDLGIQRKSRIIKGKAEKYPGKEDSSVEFFQKQQWLKENTFPLEKVIRPMKEIFEGRRFEILRNSTNITSNWPRILSPHEARICCALVLLPLQGVFKRNEPKKLRDSSHKFSHWITLFSLFQLKKELINL
ncbi:hypothetical protein NPIL_52531 [Nephila pilipes]|uniref:Uncharacterized protein n=1 Tax=Nephila pilipes TaxID=299642 RepID=A0A8X6N486_NEPPI|nr:hypothetical protein NPIL_52531 [Nephila pilipes]